MHVHINRINSENWITNFMYFTKAVMIIEIYYFLHLTKIKKAQEQQEQFKWLIFSANFMINP